MGVTSPQPPVPADDFGALLSRIADVIDGTRTMLITVEQAIYDAAQPQTGQGNPGERAKIGRLPGSALQGLQGIDRAGQRLDDLRTLIAMLGSQLAGKPVPVPPGLLADAMRLAELRQILQPEVSENSGASKGAPILF